MKFKELRDLVNSIGPEMDEAEVFSNMGIGCCGDVEDLGEVELDTQAPGSKDRGYVTLRYFPNLPGYRSCRQVAMTQKNDKDYWSQFPASPHYTGESK